MSERICPICNKPLPENAYHTAKYCSEACRKQAKSNGDKERRQYLREHGICTHCGQEQAKKGTTYCQTCLQSAKEYTAIKHARWKDQGRCPLCGKPRAKGYIVCNDCLEYQKARQHRVRAERISNGTCTLCGKRKATDGKKTCTLCRAKYYRRAA